MNFESDIRTLVNEWTHQQLQEVVAQRSLVEKMRIQAEQKRLDDLRRNYKRGDLRDAVKKGAMVKVMELLQFVNPNEDAERDEFRNTSLHAAASRGHEAIAEILISRGAFINARDKLNNTPLHNAVSRGHIETAVLLMNKGADINARDKFRCTPLHHAASRGHAESVRLLVDCGAQVNIREELQYTPLHNAVGRGHDEVSEILISKGADVNARSKVRSTPLHLAVSRGHASTARLLLENGAEPNAEDQNGATPLFGAKTEEMRKLIWQWKADYATRGGNMTQAPAAKDSLQSSTGTMDEDQ